MLVSAMTFLRPNPKAGTGNSLIGMGILGLLDEFNHAFVKRGLNGGGKVAHVWRVVRCWSNLPIHQSANPPIRQEGLALPMAVSCVHGAGGGGRRGRTGPPPSLAHGHSKKPGGVAKTLYILRKFIIMAILFRTMRIGRAQVAKLVDAGDSKSPAARCDGSSPSLGTTNPSKDSGDKRLAKAEKRGDLKVAFFCAQIGQLARWWRHAHHGSRLRPFPNPHPAPMTAPQSNRHPARPE